MIAIFYFLKASLVLAATAMAVALAGRRASSASRHFICAVGVCALLALPLLSTTLPGWTALPVSALSRVTALDSTAAGNSSSGAPVTVGIAGATESMAQQKDPSAPIATPLDTANLAAGRPAWMSWPALFAALYACGLGVLLARLLGHHLQVRRVLRQSTTLDDPEWQRLLRECAQQLGSLEPVRLLRSPECTMPMAVGLRHHTIVVPAVADTWSREQRRAVLLHELAHVVRRDCRTQTAAALACAIYWVHPGTWWLARHLRIERELACDDLVVATGTGAGEYAGHLLDLAYALRGYAAPALAVAMAGPRQLESRMLALLDAARNRTMLTRRGQAAILLVFIAVIVPIAAASTGGSRHIEQKDVPHPEGITALAQVSGAEHFARLFDLDYWHRRVVGHLIHVASQVRYTSEMRALGYSTADVATFFELRRRGVTPEYVRALAAEGLSGVSTADLLTAVAHGVTAEYIHDLTTLGYGPFDVTGLARLRSHGIDGGFIRELAEVGVAHPSIESLVQARSHGISADYIRELRALGYQWSMDDLVRARSHGVDTDYMRAIRSSDYEHIELEDLILLRIHGVEPSYIRGFQALGYFDLTPHSLANLRSHGVTPARAATANTQAGARLGVDQLTARASRRWK